MFAEPKGFDRDELGRMHAATGKLPADLPVRDSLEVPQRQEFFEALQDTRTA